MYLSGILRQCGAAIADLFLAFFIVALLKQLIFSFGLLSTALELVLLLVIFAYPLLARRGLLPSLGHWALGLHVYAYSEVEGYSGKGWLWVHEPLARSAYTRRSLIAASGILALYALNLALLSLSH